ncbi:hypothetical protein [Mycolicibacterium llatzerense]|uniref:hypothetical protein n=1 Tax=Mycolicibacterium llatzerense TaxID=280871 RepID=UPI0008DCD297|nr:hypothetical protein [Mycolicibacterium llatzerense]
MWRNLVGVAAVIASSAAVWLVTSGKHDSAAPAPVPPSVTASSSTVVVPPYQLEAGRKPSSLRVTVDRLHTLPEVTAIVADLQGQYANCPDTYFVQINCNVGKGASLDNRLANAKFAVGRIGAARTGLGDGAREISMVAGQKCPPGPLPTAAPGAVTARQVADAITAAGLPARKPRDNSESSCRSFGCVQLITTDDVSVYQFPDTAAADRMASSDMFTGYQNGPIVLAFHGAETPDYRYRDVLNHVMTQ